MVGCGVGGRETGTALVMCAGEGLDGVEAVAGGDGTMERFGDGVVDTLDMEC